MLFLPMFIFLKMIYSQNDETGVIELDGLKIRIFFAGQPWCIFLKFFPWILWVLFYGGIAVTFLKQKLKVL